MKNNDPRIAKLIDAFVSLSDLQANIMLDAIQECAKSTKQQRPLLKIVRGNFLDDADRKFSR